MASKPAIIYRPFLWLEVKQDIETMLYNATDVLKAFNKKHLKNWSNEKRMDVFINMDDTKEFIDQLEGEENLKHVPDVNKKTTIVKTKRWKFWWTWMHPKLLMDLMMWLSPEFKSKAYDFIINWYALAGKRKEISEGYKKMTKAISETWWTNFREEATLINVLVTGSPARNQRARIDIDKMEQMDNLQSANAILIKAWLSLEQRKNVLIKEL